MTKQGYIFPRRWATYVVIVAYCLCSCGGHTPAVMAPNPEVVTMVFKSDGLDDLARLIGPLSYLVSKSGNNKTELFLRDAIFSTSVNGEGRLLSIWVLQETNNAGTSPTILTGRHRPMPVSDVAGDLEEILSEPFVVMLLDVSWQNWQLSISRGPEFVVKNAGADLEQIIAATPSLITRFSTRSVAFPIGFGQTKLTAWQAWFHPDYLVLAIQPDGTAQIFIDEPDAAALSNRAGIILRDAFLNDLLKEDFKGRTFGGTINGEPIDFENLSVSCRSPSLAPGGGTMSEGVIDISGDYVERPPGSNVRIQAHFVGSDLHLQNIDALALDCPSSMPSYACAALKTKINVGIALANNQLQNGPSGSAVLPEDVQSLGDFAVGSKPLYGTVKFEQLLPADRSMALQAQFRLFQGALR